MSLPRPFDFLEEERFLEAEAFLLWLPLEALALGLEVLETEF